MTLEAKKLECVADDVSRLMKAMQDVQSQISPNVSSEISAMLMAQQTAYLSSLTVAISTATLNLK